MPHSLPWQPSASLDTLRFRAACYKKLRDFFCQRDVLEVETPLLSEAATVDPHIESLSTEVLGAKQYLQTSPEFYLKRLLAAGSGDIYSLGKVFRQGEKGRRHHPEFTLLEWYRVGWDEQQLIDEVIALIHIFLPEVIVTRYSYRQCFLNVLSIDPHSADLSTIKKLTRDKIDIEFDSPSVSDWCDILMTHCIEPALPKGLVVIDDYPKEQAALAQLGQNDQGQTVARRFEAYLNGIELANGYYELTDAYEQEQRFCVDQRYRKNNNLPIYPYDRKLVAALENGMPACSGVALGLDRLLMILCNSRDIGEVISFG